MEATPTGLSTNQVLDRKLVVTKVSEKNFPDPGAPGNHLEAGGVAN